MSAYVHFRGPILFVHDGKQLLDVRIPDANKVGYKFADKEDGDQHHAAVLVVRKDGTAEKHRPLTKSQDVTIVEGSAKQNAFLDPTFFEKVSLGKLVDAKGGTGTIREIKLDKNATGLHTLITIKGGELSVDNFSPSAHVIPYRFGKEATNKSLPVLTTWTAGAPVTVTGVSGGIITLNDGDTAYFYNWENATPSEDDLLEPIERIKGRKTVPEQDFKWLYELVQTPNVADLETWLTKTPGEKLPAPLSTILDPPAQNGPKAAPPNSACDGGTWECPPL